MIALIFALSSLPAFAQTTNPASSKPNQNTPPATNPNANSDKSISTNTNNATRTDSVVTVPKEGTSISTAPGTKKGKTTPKTTPAQNKKANPR